MTAQIHDVLWLNRKEYDIIGVEGTTPDLFVPQDYGLTPLPISSACWRGVYCEYRVIKGNLSLHRLTVYTEGQEYPLLNGQRAFPSDDGYAGEYKDLGIRLDFTGFILVGWDFIRERYVHMGFHDALSFKEVILLEFKAGALLEQFNLSALMEQERALVTQPDECAPEENIVAWIERRFSLGINKDFLDKVHR